VYLKNCSWNRWHRCIKKNGPQAIGKSRGGWTTKIHMVAADARTAITFALSPGNAHDAPEGRELLRDLGSFPGMPVIMDRAYEGNETRQLVLALDMVPVVPPKSNRVDPWRYDRTLYRKRNEIERLFRRLKGFRRIFSRFEKLDCIFLAFVSFALIVEALR
jgi:transposase